MAISSGDSWFFITELVTRNLNLGIPALEDRLFANLFFLIIYIIYFELEGEKEGKQEGKREGKKDRKKGRQKGKRSPSFNSSALASFQIGLYAFRKPPKHIKTAKFS